MFTRHKKHWFREMKVCSREDPIDARVVNSIWLKMSYKIFFLISQNNYLFSLHHQWSRKKKKQILTARYRSYFHEKFKGAYASQFHEKFKGAYASQTGLLFISILWWTDRFSVEKTTYAEHILTSNYWEEKVLHYCISA